MNIRTRTLPNHRQGVREVMVDQSGKVLPVISATRISYTDDRVTSYQRPEVDGFVIRCEIKDGSPSISINRYIPHLNKVAPVVDDVDLAVNIFSKLDDDLISWLKDVETLKQSNLLPAGFGWDGVMTQTEYAKYERIRDLFISPTPWLDKDREWLDEMIHQAVRTSNLYLQTDWNNAFRIIDNKIPVRRYFPELTKVYLVYFDKDGNRTVKLVRRPIYVGGKKSNVPETVEVPKEAVKAILLCTNAMVEASESYGVSIDLFNRTK